MTILDIAQSMKGRLRDGYSTQQSGVTADGGAVEYGTAIGDSSGGYVTVVMDGSPDQSATYQFEVEVDAPVTDGDRIAYVRQGGQAKAISLGTLTQIAEDADAIATATDQHFWADTNGVHVSTDEDDPAGTRNILINSLGILLRKAANTLVSISETAVAFFDGSGNQTASFGTSGAVIGKVVNGESRAEVSTDGLHVYQRVNGADESIADLGYGLGYNSQGTLVYGPFYTIGHRLAGSAVGVDSVAEGAGTTASGTQSHAEGAGSVASSINSHAEGQETTASGGGSHAEGNGSVASGLASHAQNTFTIAAGNSQTAIGKYNVQNVSDYALIVGNGTADNARSDAFRVAWNGDIEAAGEVIDGNGNKLSDPCDLSTATGTLPIASGGSGQTGTDYINTVADLIAAGSGVTVSAARFAYWGKCAMLQLNVARSSAISNGGTFTIGTVTAGHRPLYQAGGSGARLIGELATNGTITARNVSGSQIAANTTVYITFTYLLP